MPNSAAASVARSRRNSNRSVRIVIGLKERKLK
jgi:hypothetical protein